MSTKDTILSAVKARAEKLGMSSYAIAKATGDVVSEDAVRKYLTGKQSLGSDRLSLVLAVVGLRLVPTRPATGRKSKSS